MKENKDYININRDSWNNRLDAHLKSDFYDLKRFIEGKNTLNDIELGLLGDIKGKKILHLQCHFGQDSISLARLGADVAAIDLSDKSIQEAKKLADKIGVNVNFICCDVYDLLNHLNDEFDIVFTSYGVISWLPDLNKWAEIISKFMKADGKFVFVEFHPVLWMFDDAFNKVENSYFNTKAMIYEEQGTYADKNAGISQKSVNWNHGIGEIFTNLTKNNLKISSFQEYDYSPFDCFDCTEEYLKEKYRIKHLANNIPMVFSLVAEKM